MFFCLFYKIRNRKINFFFKTDKYCRSDAFMIRNRVTRSNIRYNPAVRKHRFWCRGNSASRVLAPSRPDGRARSLSRSPAAVEARRLRRSPSVRPQPDRPSCRPHHPLPSLRRASQGPRLRVLIIGSYSATTRLGQVIPVSEQPSFPQLFSKLSNCAILPVIIVTKFQYNAI